MTTQAGRLSPLEIVRGLDLVQIDAAIRETEGELEALRALRSVAASRRATPSGNGKGRGPAASTRSGSPSTSRSTSPSGSGAAAPAASASPSAARTTVEDRLVELLSSEGPMTFAAAASRLRCDMPGLYRLARKEGGRVVKDGPNVRLRSTASGEGSPAITPRLLVG